MSPCILSSEAHPVGNKQAKALYFTNDVQYCVSVQAFRGLCDGSINWELEASGRFRSREERLRAKDNANTTDHDFAMRLLSFLTEVERAIVANAPVDHPGWQAARIVNFQQGMARLSMTLAGGVSGPALDGAIFLQGFALADGSLCLKASLTWRGSETFPAIAIYTTPSTDWKLEASRVAAAWLQGPPVLASNAGVPEQENRLVAEAS